MKNVLLSIMVALAVASVVATVMLIIVAHTTGDAALAMNNAGLALKRASPAGLIVFLVTYARLRRPRKCYPDGG